MSALSKLKVGLVAAGLSCLVIGLAWAQEETEREYGGQGATQARDTDSNRGDIDRPGTLARQPRTAHFRGTQPGDAEQQELQQFLAGCLLQKNKMEVELGQIAQRQAQNPQVKQFAQRMVQGHEQLVQKVQPLAGMAGARSNAAGQSDAQRPNSGATRFPGSPGAGQADRDADQSLSTARTARHQNSAIRELSQIEHQITQRYFDAVREDLQQKQGTEFDKCYLATQIGGHMHMLAALEVIEQQGPDQLRQIAQQWQPTVEQHLEQAKQLMKHLETAGPATGQAERQSPSTQR